MRYYLNGYSIEDTLEIEIDEAKFCLIKSAQKSLSSGLAIEEKYELLLSNFIEFEQEVAHVSIDNIIRSDNEYIDFIYIRLGLNRRIVNLLTSTRMYTEQLIQHVRVCIPEIANIKDDIKSYLSEEYDLNFEYRFMESLRNYVQHRGMAIHTLKSGGDCVKEDRSHMEFYLKLVALKNVLEHDKAFKKKIAEEMPDEVELILSTRVYVSAISRIHEKVRKLIKDKLDQSRDIIDQVIVEYKAQKGGNTPRLRATSQKIAPPNEIVENVPIFLDWDDVRIKLTNRNRNLVNLEKRYVRGKAGL